MISEKPNDQFRTPASLFARYDRLYGFTVDGAASKHDSLCVDNHWGPGGGVNDFFDTTAVDWAGESVWINPPYSMIPEFLAHAEKFRHNYNVLVWLLPSWTDRKWMSRHIWGGGGLKPYTKIDFLPGRPKFLMPDGTQPLDKHGKPQGGKFASMAVTCYNQPL